MYRSIRTRVSRPTVHERKETNKDRVLPCVTDSEAVRAAAEAVQPCIQELTVSNLSVPPRALHAVYERVGVGRWRTDSTYRGKNGRDLRKLGVCKLDQDVFSEGIQGTLANAKYEIALFSCQATVLRSRGKRKQVELSNTNLLHAEQGSVCVPGG